MKLNKLAVSSAVLTCLSFTSTAIAADEWIDIYGKINLSIDKVDTNSIDAESSDKDQWELTSHDSRIGVKGKGAAGDLEVFYQLEWGVDITEADGEKDNIKSRNQILGFRGGFGEVFAGRHDTPTKKLQKKIDLFGDLAGDIKYSFNGEKRASNIVQYTTPKAGGFKAKVAFVPGEETGSNDGLADGTSIALEYKINQLSLGVSFDSDVEKNDLNTSRMMAQYQMDAWQFGLMYQDAEYHDLDSTGFMASAKYTQGNNSFKLQLSDSDIWKSEIKPGKLKYSSQISVGWDRKLGKKTKFYTYLTQSEVGQTREDDSIFGVGIIQKF